MSGKRIYRSILFCLLASLVLYVAYEFWYIETTEDIPYRNLREISSSGCYVYFNISYEDKVYPVVFENRPLPFMLGREKRFIIPIYPVYMNQIIRNEWSINVSDSLFREFQYSIPPKDLIEKFTVYDPLLDTSYIENNCISYRISQDEQNAIIYVLLKRGINCCVTDMSGRIYVY